MNQPIPLTRLISYPLDKVTMNNNQADKKQEMPEFLKAFFEQSSPPEGGGNDYFVLNWTILLMFVPFLVYLLAFFENMYVDWGLHLYSLAMIILYSMSISKFKEHMAYVSNPFDFVKVELLQFINVVVFFGFAFYFLSTLIAKQYNHVKLAIIDAIYFSFVTVATLGYGDIYPIGWYAKLLTIFEIIFGIWFFVTVIPVAVADQAERLRHFRIKRQEFAAKLKEAFENGELKNPSKDENSNI